MEDCVCTMKEQKIRGKEADIYSFGRIVYELVTTMQAHTALYALPQSNPLSSLVTSTENHSINEIKKKFEEIDFNSKNVTFIREKELKLAESLKKKISDLFDSNSRELSGEQIECMKKAIERFGVGVKKIADDGDDNDSFYYSYYSIDKMKYFGDLPSENMLMLKKYLSLMDHIDWNHNNTKQQQETESDLTYEKIFEKLNKNLYGMFEAKNDFLNLLARKKFIRNITTYKIISEMELEKPILLSGNEGVGKTSLVKEIAEILKRKVY